MVGLHPPRSCCNSRSVPDLDTDFHVLVRCGYVWHLLCICHDCCAYHKMFGRDFTAACYSTSHECARTRLWVFGSGRNLFYVDAFTVGCNEVWEEVAPKLGIYERLLRVRIFGLVIDEVRGNRGVSEGEVLRSPILEMI